MNRNEMIKWLSENTTQEQWSGRGPVFTLPVAYWHVLTVIGGVTVIHIGPGQPFRPILFDDVFEQPAFIDGAEYFIHPLKDLGIPLKGVKFIYDSNTNRFNGYAGIWLKASGFGKDFTVELVDGPKQPVFIDGAEYFIHPSKYLVKSLKELGYRFDNFKFTYDRNTNRFNSSDNKWFSVCASDFGKGFTVDLVPVDTETLIDELKSGDRTINDVRRILKAVRQPPRAPEVPPQTNVNALGQYLKVNSYDTQEIAGAALSRLKEQDVIVGRVGKLNEVCQKHGIGSMGDSVIDSVIDYIGKQESLYERVVKALGERKVPIRGADHLVGQVKVDHKKAALLDKVIKEFKIPEGGDIINWLYNRTKQTPAVHNKVTLEAMAAEPTDNIYESADDLFEEVLGVKYHNKPRNKYDREILPGVYVDVYDVLGAFKTNSAAIDHAVKKLLAPGQRGVKDRITDLNEAIESIQREIDRVNEWGDK